MAYFKVILSNHRNSMLFILSKGTFRCFVVKPTTRYCDLCCWFLQVLSSYPKPWSCQPRVACSPTSLEHPRCETACTVHTLVMVYLPLGSIVRFNLMTLIVVRCSKNSGFLSIKRLSLLPWSEIADFRFFYLPFVSLLVCIVLRGGIHRLTRTRPLWVPDGLGRRHLVMAS